MKEQADKVHHIAERIEMEGLSKPEVREIIREEFGLVDNLKIDHIAHQVWSEYDRVFASAA